VSHVLVAAVPSQGVDLLNDLPVANIVALVGGVPLPQALLRAEFIDHLHIGGVGGVLVVVGDDVVMVYEADFDHVLVEAVPHIPEPQQGR